MFMPGQAARWLPPTLVSCAIFLVLFYRVYYRSRAQIVWNALVIALLGLALTPINPGAGCFMIYACAFLAFHGTSREAARNMAIVLAVYSASNGCGSISASWAWSATSSSDSPSVS